MSAISKTKNLLRFDLPLSLLVKNTENPNKMNDRAFNLLVDNLEKTGITDPILCRPEDYALVLDLVNSGLKGDKLRNHIIKNDIKFRIVGGHHRFEAASYIGFEEVPCTIIMDESFDQDQERFQLVRMNMIRGKMDAQAFFDLYNHLTPTYSDEILQDAFGFAEEAEFQKLIDQTAKALPDKHMQQKFKEAAADIKTVDGLSKLLNEMFTKYGDTLPYGYMAFDFGGQRSMWLRMNGKTMKAMDMIGTMCIDNQRTMDDVVGYILQQIAKGATQELVAEAIANSDGRVIPEGFAVAPTLDNLEKAANL